jgi:hypothetical protein
MALDASSIPTYTDAQLLAAVRYAKMHIMLGGQSHDIGGRRFTRANLAELDAIEKELADKIAAVEGDGTIALARFNRLS